MEDYKNTWNYSDMLNEYGLEYLSEVCPENEPFQMEDINEYLAGNSPSEIIRMVFHGKRYGYEHDNFNPNDEYFTFNGYGNLISIPYIEDYLENQINENDFQEWCKEQGYIED